MKFSKQELPITINRRHLAALAVALLLAGVQHLHATGWIRVNQLGYLPDATKVAVLMSQDKVQITEFVLVDAYSQDTVYRSTATRDMGPWGQMAATCRLDFSGFHGEGAFRILAGDIQSPVFPVNGRVWDGTADFVLNYMR